MHQSPFLQLLKTLNTNELTAFSKYLKKQIARNSQIADLWQYIWTTRPDFVHKKLDKEKVQRYLAKKGSATDVRIRQLFSELNTFLKDFLVDEEVQNDPVLKAHLLYQALEKRQQLKAAEGILKKAKTDFTNRSQSQDVAYFYDQFLLKNDHFRLAMRLNNRQTAVSMQEVIADFDTYYWVQRLRFACILLNNTQVLAHDTLPQNLQALVTHIPETLRKESLFVDIYYHLLLILTHQHTSKTWENLLTLLYGNLYTALSRESIKNVTDIAINYCNKHLRIGDNSYLKQQFDLYKFKLEKGFLMENGILSVIYYKNLVRLACRFGEFEWASDFVKKYKSALAERHQENYFHFNLATIYHYQRQYKAVIAELEQISNTGWGTLDYLNRFMLSIKTYYALMTQGADCEDDLNKQLGNLAIYRIRNADAKRIKFTEYQRFINLFTRFLGIQKSVPVYLSKQDREKLEQRLALLLQEIEGSELVDKKWLVEQVRQCKM